MNLVIDGSALVADHFSGIGHYIQGIVEEIDAQLGDMENMTVYIAVPYKRADRLKKYHFKHIKTLKIPLTMRIMRGLVVRDSLPVMDILLGKKGVYFFPDYNTWPLSSSSKAITTIHDLSFIDVPEFVDDNNARFLCDTLEKTLQRTCKIATVTHTMKDILVKRYDLDPDDVLVTENAVDMKDLYKRSDQEVREVKRRLRIAGKYILSFGNIEPRKNQLALIDAMRLCSQKVRDTYTLLFVGAGGWKMDAIDEAVANALKDGIKVQVLLGKVNDHDRPAVYSGASIVAQPSHYEGFGMPIIEAMACRVPLITSNTSVMPEVAGDAAVLIDPSSPEDIARAIEKIDTWTPQQREDAIQKGVEHARHYQWKNAVDVLFNAVREEG